jgi:hypothetical protein
VQQNVTQSVPHVSRSSGGFKPMTKHQPKNEVQFHYENGVGGIVGVYGLDLMDGVINEPERLLLM